MGLGQHYGGLNQISYAPAARMAATMDAIGLAASGRIS